jgi:hypothetical protein
MITPNYHRGWEVFSQRERGIMLGGRKRACPFSAKWLCIKIKERVYFHKRAKKQNERENGNEVEI